MDEKYGFCIKCGQELPEGSEFCPECGQRVGGYINDRQENSKGNSVNLNTITILIFIYAAFAILVGLFCVYIAMESTVLLEMMKEMAPEEYQQLIDMGVTAEMLSTIYAFPAFFMTASGILALISGMFVNKKTNNQWAFILCLLASILSFPLIITIIVGLIVSFKIREAQPQFSS
jgi:uncharacterized membrane protein HdeD (DUF308 family)